MLSFQGGEFLPPYTTSKHGVAGVTKVFTNYRIIQIIQKIQNTI